MVFYAVGSNGIYLLPEDYIVRYVPDRFEGYSDFFFLLSGLQEVGRIKSKWDFTWKLDMENWDFENPPYDEGDVPEGRRRIMLFYKESEKYFGMFDVEFSSQSIYDVETGERIYHRIKY